MGITRTVCCSHFEGLSAFYVVNDGQSAPTVLIEGDLRGAVVMTLTNQTIYFKCPGCFKAARAVIDLKPNASAVD